MNTNHEASVKDALAKATQVKEPLTKPLFSNVWGLKPSNTAKSKAGHQALPFSLQSVFSRASHVRKATLAPWAMASAFVGFAAWRSIRGHDAWDQAWATISAVFALVLMLGALKRWSWPGSWLLGARTKVGQSFWVIASIIGLNAAIVGAVGQNFSALMIGLVFILALSARGAIASRGELAGVLLGSALVWGFGLPAQVWIEQPLAPFAAILAIMAIQERQSCSRTLTNVLEALKTSSASKASTSSSVFTPTAGGASMLAPAGIDSEMETDHGDPISSMGLPRLFVGLNDRELLMKPSANSEARELVGLRKRLLLEVDEEPSPSLCASPLSSMSYSKPLHRPEFGEKTLYFSGAMAVVPANSQDDFFRQPMSSSGSTPLFESRPPENLPMSLEKSQKLIDENHFHLDFEPDSQSSQLERESMTVVNPHDVLKSDAVDPNGDTQIEVLANKGLPMAAQRVISLPSETLALGALDRSKIRILVVEDSPDIRRVISFMLQRSGYKHELVENGRIAVDKALVESFDLILMDMQMPVLDGYGAARELREHGCQIPIIAVTAHTLAGCREECLAAGCTDYLPKPINRQDLMSLVGHYLGESAPACVR